MKGFKMEIYNKLKIYFLNLNEKLVKWLQKIQEKYSYLKKPFFILTVIYCLAFYPIARANFNYIDDLARVNTGARGWSNFSRFVSEYLSVFIHSSRYLTDISPLPQLIAIFLLVLSSLIILHLFKNGKKITLINMISVIPLALSPYFLECLSYKFDSPYMALSIFASVFPFLFYGKENKKKLTFSFVTFLGTLVMCTTYQAASGIIPLMALFLSFQFWKEKEGKEAIKLLGLSAISYLLGLITFKLFIMIPADTYVSSSFLPIKELIPGFFGNLKTYYGYVRSDFRKSCLLLIGLMTICFIFIQVKQSKQKKVLSILVSIMLLAFSGLLVFGLYPGLVKPLFLPRAMYGFGILLALLGVNSTNSEKLYFPKLIVLGLCWFLFTFSFTYGNALSEQKRYIDFRVQSVVNELNNLTQNTSKTIQLNGTIGKAPAIEHMPQGYQNILHRLITQSFGSVWMWDIYYFVHYFKLNNVLVISDENAVIPDNLEVLKDTMYYTIEVNDQDYILITLK